VYECMKQSIGDMPMLVASLEKRNGKNNTTNDVLTT